MFIGGVSKQEFMQMDRFCDTVPVVSTLTNLINFIAKVVFDARGGEIDAGSYRGHLETKGYARIFWSAIPFLGNLSAYLYGGKKVEEEDDLSSMCSEDLDDLDSVSSEETESVYSDTDVDDDIEEMSTVLALYGKREERPLVERCLRPGECYLELVSLLFLARLVLFALRI
ncbi:MAG: hypothetical protein FJZ58_06530 [Chlamydiae bacterium]|jgi:hypothetical protein|nr:hypothetical protein [Chlamydiota bacterium]